MYVVRKICIVIIQQISMKNDLEIAYEAMTAPHSIRWFLGALKDELVWKIKTALNWTW